MERKVNFEKSLQVEILALFGSLSLYLKFEKDRILDEILNVFYICPLLA